MILSLIVAADENNAIGINNELPWHLPEDLKFFKRTTMGKPVIMGRKTFESLGKPLPGRLNVVLSGDPALQLPEGVMLFQDILSAVKYVENTLAEEAFILGGGRVFAQTTELADRMYITRVHTKLPAADTYFPAIDHTHWKLTWQEPHYADEKHKYDYTFECYERIDL